MAIYHLSAQVLSRSGGSSAVAAAAYRSGGRLFDERTGETHDYSRRRGVDHAEIVAPDGAPEWALDRERLWNAAEAAERRKDAQVAREVRVAIPAELDGDDRRELVREFAREQFAERGMVADIAWHDGRGENPHAHIQLTMRPLDGGRFSARKERSWNSKQTLVGWREAWAEKANRTLERAGEEARIDHRTLAEQRAEALERGEAGRAEELDREPQIHLGKAAHAEEGGRRTERGDRYLAIDERNRERTAARRDRHLIRQLQSRLEVLRRFGERLRQLQSRLWRQAERLGAPGVRKQGRRERRPDRAPDWSR